MYYIFYQAVESAVFKNLENGIENLLNYSRENNKKLNITGLLLFIEGTFIQYIEGEEFEVRKLYESIKEDKRLAIVKTIDEGTTDKRIFENWDMAYDEFTIETVNKIEKIKYPNIQKYLATASAIKLIKLMVQRKKIFEGLDSQSI